MRLRIQHLTTHRYQAPVSFSDHRLFLRPVGAVARQVESFRVSTQPSGAQRWLQDLHGNEVLCCNFGLEEADCLKFSVETVVHIQETNPYDFVLAPEATGYPFRYQEHELRGLSVYRDTQQKSGALSVLDWFYTAVEQPVQHPNLIAFLVDLNESIRREVSYQAREEEGIQDPDTTVQLLTGSCRDMAVLFIEIVRQLGFAARFVSGYLYDPPVDEAGGHVFNRAVGAMHAWAEVYLPGVGWKGFDPTNGILANHFFVPCAVSHDPLAVSPIQGNYYSHERVESAISVKLIIEAIEDDSA